MTGHFGGKPTPPIWKTDCELVCVRHNLQRNNAHAITLLANNHRAAHSSREARNKTNHRGENRNRSIRRKREREKNEYGTGIVSPSIVYIGPCRRSHGRVILLYNGSRGIIMEASRKPIDMSVVAMASPAAQGDFSVTL